MTTVGGSNNNTQILRKLCTFGRKCIFRILSVGPLPNHISFIMDGNRRYAKKHNLKEGDGHRFGFLTLMSMLKYCYELNIKYVSIYAFSIDNFRRQPEEVTHLMALMQEKIEGVLNEQNIMDEYGIRIHFLGNLNLLNEKVRIAAEKAEKATAGNSNIVLLVCVAYTSTDEIAHAVLRACEDRREILRNIGKDANEGLSEDVGDGVIMANEVMMKRREFYGDDEVIKVVDIERHMYMKSVPDPDILIRTSGETRLSNFVLWQTTNCLLYCPAALWPELGLRQLVWAVLNFQRHHNYLEKKKKQS